MKYLVWLVLTIFPLGQLLRWNLPGTTVIVQGNDLAVGLLVSIWLVVNRKRLKRLLTKERLFFPIVMVTTVMVLSLLVNWWRLPIREILVGGLYLLRWVVYAGLYFVFRDLPKNTKKLAVKWLIVDVLLVAMVGLLQFIFLPDVSFLAAFEWDNHYYRLVSTFLDPGFTGAILVLGTIMGIGGIRGIRGIGIAGVLYLAMALTYSRASYLMYLVSFAAIGWYRKSIRIFVIAAVVLAVTLPLLPKTFGEGTKLNRENSIIARLNNWKQTVAVWTRYPVLGSGFDAYRYTSGSTLESHAGAGADSSILLILATTGIVGLAAYIWLLFIMWQEGRKSLVFAAAFLGILVHSWFNNTLFYPWVMEWLWIVLAIKESI